jgi:hypothetical protein
MIDLPKVDRRTAADIAGEVLVHLRLNRLRKEQLKGRFDVALVNIFSRFSELVIERLNRAPEKKFLAFLDLAGISPLPMEAAAVPLTFYLASQATGHAVVPAGAQVAAPPPANGNQRPVIFETQSELVVTATQLDSLFAKNGFAAARCGRGPRSRMCRRFPADPASLLSFHTQQSCMGDSRPVKSAIRD